MKTFTLLILLSCYSQLLPLNEVTGLRNSEWISFKYRRIANSRIEMTFKNEHPSKSIRFILTSIFDDYYSEITLPPKTETKAFILTYKANEVFYTIKNVQLITLERI